MGWFGISLNGLLWTTAKKIQGRSISYQICIKRFGNWNAGKKHLSAKIFLSMRVISAAICAAEMALSGHNTTIIMHDHRS